MDTNTSFPIDENGYYLRVFPWTAIPENLINAVKTDVSTFSSSGIWYGYDIFFWKRNGLPFSVRTINSSSKEWLIHYVAFLSKLYAWRIAFSLKPLNLPEKYEHSRSVWSFKRSKVFPMKWAWSVAGDDFEGSASFVSSIVSEWLSRFSNENGVTKISFSFTESNWWYSRLIEAFLLEMKKSGMSQEDRAVFDDAEKKKPIHRFIYQWKISASWVSDTFPRVIRRIIQWYRSDRNSYRLKTTKNRHYPGRRLIDAEKLLSQGILAPRANAFRGVQRIPILPIHPSAFTDGFAYHSPNNLWNQSHFQ